MRQGLMSDKPFLERAFELARSGEVQSVDELRKRLAAEYGDRAAAGHLRGRALQRQLRDEIAAAGARTP